MIVPIEFRVAKEVNITKHYRNMSTTIEVSSYNIDTTRLNHLFQYNGKQFGYHGGPINHNAQIVSKGDDIYIKYGGYIKCNWTTAVQFTSKLISKHYLELIYEPYSIKYHDRTNHYLQGKLHRVDGPAIEHDNGTNEWYINDNLHRDGDLPAIERVDGYRAWYRDDKLHRDGDEPSELEANGAIYYHKDGKLHREGDKPAYICGLYSSWYRDGKRHRDGNKPAVEYKNGKMQYFKNGVEYIPTPRKKTIIMLQEGAANIACEVVDGTVVITHD